MRFFVIQHGLRDRHSHALVEAFGWRRAFRRRGLEFDIFIHREATAQVIEQTGGIPAFPFAPMDEIDLDPVSDELHSYILLGEAFAQACSMLDEHIRATDVVIVPHANARELFGISRWLRTLAPDRRPRIVFIFINPELRWKLSDDRRSVVGEFSFYRLGANLLAELMPKDRVVYFADNQLLRETIANVLNRPCGHCPMTIDYFAAEDVPGDSDDPEWAPAHIGVLGEFRREKGSSVVVEVIQKFCEARPGRDIFVQVQDAEQAKAMDQRLRSHGGRSLHIHGGQLSPRSYARRLESLEILLLPYVKDRYVMRTSGIFAEAVTHGIVTVVPRGTWMAEQLGAGWGAGVIFDTVSVDSVVEALTAAIDDYSDLKMTAAACREAWRTRQSTGALLDHILAALGTSASELKDSMPEVTP